MRKLTHLTQADQVAFLRAMVNAYKGSQFIRDRALAIVFPTCPAKAKACQALAIGAWVQKHIRYVNEGVEGFQTPVRTLTHRFGDCDDHTTLICALLESIGIKSELVAMKWNGQFRHIFARAVLQGPRGPVRIPLDSTLSPPVSALTNPIVVSVERGDRPEILAL